MQKKSKKLCIVSVPGDRVWMGHKKSPWHFRLSSPNIIHTQKHIRVQVYIMQSLEVNSDAEVSSKLLSYAEFRCQ